MIKNIIIPALLLTALVLSSCGAIDETVSDSGQSVKEAFQITDIEETSESTVFSEATETSAPETTPEETEHTSAGNYDEDSWEYLIESYYNSYNSADYKKIVSMMLPQKIYSMMEESGRLSDETISSLIPENVTSDDKIEGLTLTKLDELNDEDRSELASVFDQTAASMELLASYGNNAEAVPEEEMEQIEKNFLEPDPNADHIFNITTAFEVKAGYTLNGEDDFEYFYVFLIENEGWKLQPSMRKWVENAQKNRAFAEAKTWYCTLETIFCEAEMIWENIPQNFIFSSEDEMMVNVPDEFGQYIKEKTENELSYATTKEYKYFAVVNDFSVLYLACWKEAEYGSLYTSSYPPKQQTVKINNTEVEIPDDFNPEELWERFKSVIG